MHRTTPDAEDRRRAYIRVGAAAVAVFLVLLLVAATRGPAHADSSVPVSAPVQRQPAPPAQPGFGHHRHHHDGFGQGGAPDGGSPS